MIDKTGLQAAVKELKEALFRTGKGPKDHYQELYDLLLNAKSDEDILRVVRVILPSGKILQFADFTHEEEKLWNKMWEEANWINKSTTKG